MNWLLWLVRQILIFAEQPVIETRNQSFGLKKCNLGVLYPVLVTFKTSLPHADERYEVPAVAAGG